jgi:hypothetical protein
MTGFKAGEQVLVRGRAATFVRVVAGGAVIRYHDAPTEPKVVPLTRVEPDPSRQGD